MEDWLEYQNKVASIYERLGFNVQVEHNVQGARGIHRIDVYVTGKIGSHNFSWVVECKNWNSPVTKEKIMALQSIVNDVGADKGVLIAKSGFQAGGISSAQYANIILSSVDKLLNENLANLKRKDTELLLSRIKTVESQLNRLHKSREDLSSSKFSSLIDQITIIPFAIDDGLNNVFPTTYTVDEEGDRYDANDWEDLIIKCNSLLDSAEKTVKDSGA